MNEITSVRVQQAVVLSALRRQDQRTARIASLAAAINRGLSPGVEPITIKEVECTLAALRLRPGLKLSIHASSEPNVRVDKFQRPSIGHAALASTFLLAACATPFAELSPKPSMPGYFGGDGPVMRRATSIHTSGTPEYKSEVVDCGGFFCISQSIHSAKTVTTKTLLPSASTSLASVSYFNDLNFFALAATQEPTFAAPLPSSPARIVASNLTPQVAPSFSEPAPSSSIPLSAAATKQHVDVVSTGRSNAEVPPTLATSLLVAPSVHDVSTDVDHYLVTFRNGSQLYSKQAHLQTRSIADRLDPSDKIELRGRVGKTSITKEDAKLAVARAIAVRKQLVAFGFSEANIRIRLPRSADLLDHSSFDAPVNMSVSVFRTTSQSSLASRRYSSTAS